MVKLEHGAYRQNANDPGKDVDENDHRHESGANE
jgi:hypothetical protein